MLSRLSSLCVRFSALRARQAATVAAQSGFVTVKGRHFQLDGKPYYYRGRESLVRHVPRFAGQDRRSRAAQKELDQLAAQGITNLRVLAISEAARSSAR